MTKIYNVHIYRELRLAFAGIEADSHQEAAALAREKPTDAADSLDDCEGDSFAALVDIHGDEDFRDSRIVLFEEERMRKAAPIMLRALKLTADHLMGRPDSADDTETMVRDAIRDAIALAEPGTVEEVP